MLPVIPFEVLLPITIGATLLCLGLVLFIVLRRGIARWYSRGGERLASEAERMVRAAYASSSSSGVAIVEWLGRAPQRIDGLVLAVERVEAQNGNLRGWLQHKTRIPGWLSEVVGTVPSGVDRWFNTSRWSRVAAAKAIARLRLLSALPVLSDAMDDDDVDVGYAAADAVARFNEPEAAHVILDRISSQPKLNNARLAALLEGMSCDLTDVFREHLERTDSQTLFWTATLIGQKEIFELVTAVRPLLASEDANVRAAACECIGELAIPLTERWLAPLLHDEKWFVQSHAAKALGDLRATWAVPDLVDLLDSSEWWVRQNAADALIRMGNASADLVEALLDSEDRFTRNTAVEILERIGWIETALQRAVRGETLAEKLLRQFAANGGVGYLENAVFTAPEEAIPILLKILRKQGDDATYGRLRAAAEQRPEWLREAIQAVAAEMRAK